MHETTEYAPTVVERVTWRTRYALHGLRGAAWRKAAHLMPPRLKYLAAIDLVAGVAADDASTVRAVEAIDRYERRHRIEAS